MKRLSTFEQIKAKKKIFVCTTAVVLDTETGELTEIHLGMALPIISLDFYLDGIDELFNVIDSFDTSLHLFYSTSVSHGINGKVSCEELFDNALVLDEARPVIYHNNLVPLAKRYKESIRILKLISNINSYISRYENKIR